MWLLRLAVAFSFASLAYSQALEDGKRAFDSGRYSDALAFFEKAHRESSDCEIVLYRGLARYRLNQPDAALIDFQTATQCDPKLIGAHLAVAEAYSERHNDNEALVSFSRVLELERSNTAALRGASAVYLKADANEQAVPLLERLVAADPKDVQAHADLGAAYVATGNREAAAIQFQKALRMKPDHASALLGLGGLYLKNADEAGAIPLLIRATQVAPRAYEPLYLLGTAYNRLGRFDEALAVLEKALKLGGTEPEVYYHLARAYSGLNRPEERRKALAEFAELSRKAKQSLETQRTALRLMDQAKSLVDSGNLESALQRLEEARELRPADDRILFRMAGLEFDLKRFDVARNYAQEAISLAPAVWLYRYLIGLVEKSSGAWPEARTSLEMAVQLNPTAAEAFNALGEVHEHDGNAAAAIASFQKAADLDPHQPAYRLNLESAKRTRE